MASRTFLFANFVSATLVSAVDSFDTELNVGPTAAGLMPQPDEAIDTVFQLVLNDGLRSPEIVTCVRNDRNGVLIVERGAETTTPQTWLEGTQAKITVTALFLNSLSQSKEILYEAARYTYIAYADQADGTGFTTQFDPTKAYVAFLLTQTKLDTPARSDFDGLWLGFRGAQGVAGVRGPEGPRGPTGKTGDKGDKGDTGTQTPTGTVVMTYRKSAPDGWIMHKNGTVGDSNSGAGYAAADAEDLFAVLWDIASVVYDSSGNQQPKSASAGNDWDAHRRVKMPDGPGLTLAAAGGDFSLGEVDGNDSFKLDEDNIPLHSFYVTLADSGNGDELPNNKDNSLKPMRNYSNDAQNYTLSTGSGTPTQGKTNEYGKASPDSIPLKPKSAHFNLMVKL